MIDSGWLAGFSAAVGTSPRVATAALVVAAYGLFCAVIYLRHFRRRTRGTVVPFESSAQRPTLVAYASQTGYAEELAIQTSDRIRGAGQAVSLLSFEALDRPALLRASRVLFVVSTTGEGDAPDSAAKFCRDVLPAPGTLEGLEYGLLALGDRSYSQYCAFGYLLDSWLKSQGARPLHDVVDVNDGDPAAIERWRAHVAALCGGAGEQAWSGVSFSRWRVVEQRLLNPGSPGGPAFHVALAASDDADVTWEPGDIAEIVPAAPASAPPPADLPTREYSIASLPCDGRLELLVRQVQRPDGSLGLGSGWLTSDVSPGGEIWLRVRANRAFRPPDPDRPMMLIGNGTGLAGLRAHIKARALRGSRRNWLLFGERTRCHDVFHRDELDDWLARGVLERCDLAFSRDTPVRQYVQDVLRLAGDDVRRWVDEGAAIYVCGSRLGMATGVHDALVDLLGASGVERLQDEGRYRRDVY